MRLARVLRQMRTAKRWTQRDLAKRVQLTPGYIALLELGARTPSLATLKRLAKALGVPMAALLK